MSSKNTTIMMPKKPRYNFRNETIFDDSEATEKWAYEQSKRQPSLPLEGELKIKPGVVLNNNNLKPVVNNDNNFKPEKIQEPSLPEASMLDTKIDLKPTPATKDNSPIDNQNAKPVDVPIATTSIPIMQTVNASFPRSEIVANNESVNKIDHTPLIILATLVGITAIVLITVNFKESKSQTKITQIVE